MKKKKKKNYTGEKKKFHRSVGARKLVSSKTSTLNDIHLTWNEQAVVWLQ